MVSFLYPFRKMRYSCQIYEINHLKIENFVSVSMFDKLRGVNIGSLTFDPQSGQVKDFNLNPVFSLFEIFINDNIRKSDLTKIMINNVKNKIKTDKLIFGYKYTDECIISAGGIKINDDYVLPIEK